jgi:nitrile hydratase subunit beta
VDGTHDLGGKTGFGAVIVESHDTVFHSPWEGRVRGLQQALSRATSTKIDERRHALERMDPEHYLSASYYERWLTATATLAVEHGYVSVEELESLAGGVFPLSRPARYSSEFGDRVTAADRPRFEPGVRVKVLDLRPLGHCRCPAYVRGHTGLVTRCNGPYPLPDLVAHGLPARLDYCDNVEFSGTDLFEDADPSVKVRIDLFEAYLEAAP